MRLNALSIANYFIDLAESEGTTITQLGLMKRVYASYGFGLAILNRSIIDDRFDTVQAWKYGPVIPSVYHTFKRFKGSPITDKSVLEIWDDEKEEAIYITPELEDNDVKGVVKMVWERYKGISDREMVSLTHRNGTPWDLCYIPEMNAAIPESFTKLYYSKLVSSILKSENNG